MRPQRPTPIKEPTKSLPHNFLHLTRPVMMHRVHVTLVRFRYKTLVIFGCVQGFATKTTLLSVGKHQGHLVNVGTECAWIGSGNDS